VTTRPTRVNDDPARADRPATAPLLPRVAHGDAAAVREVLSRYGGLVWTLAQRMLANRADAEDAVQEIFLDLWSHAGRFDPKLASEATFVALLARRRLIDRRRRGSRRPTPQPLPPQLAGPDEADAPAELADEARHARAALAQLRPEQRRVLELAIDRGLTHEEIARVTGLPLGTVKTHARRGLIRLRELLDVPPPGGDR
jgi:RNA polymerase sigma factor (sigma-70 family)